MRPLLLTPGDPAGIGPEVLIGALKLRGRFDDCVAVGAFEPLEREARRLELPLRRSRVLQPAADALAVFEPDGAEPVEIAAIRVAVADQLAGRSRALVTGPIHKGRLMRQGFRHRGHTDFLGELCGVERPVMAFVGGRLKVALVTVHVPLRRVPELVTPQRVLHTLQTTDAALRDQLGLPAPRLLVAGLNPHAGDDGALGHEDSEHVLPAIEQARALGIDARGPISIENAVRAVLAGDGDMVIAMYHDQGLAPLKAIDFGQSVNWTLGLPIVRTSVDHGTADDIAGEGVADPRSMWAAIRLAEQLTAP